MRANFAVVILDVTGPSARTFVAESARPATASAAAVKRCLESALRMSILPSWTASVPDIP
jgi:hypothetical protein